jgi:predicted dehydrogenase
MDRTNLALIGCGHYAAGYLKELVSNPQARLGVTCDSSREHAEAAAAQVGAVAMTEWEQALDTPGLEGVIIATPNYLHARITLAAVARGLHVLCEKPMATTLEDAHKMIEACEAAGVTLMIGLSSRYDRAFRRALALLQSGDLGEPALLANLYHYALQPADPGRTWHNDPAQMGGGALIQMGIHGIDRVCWLAGGAPARVYAQMVKAGQRWVENVDLVQMTFPGELLGQVEVAGLADPQVNTLTIHAQRGEMIVEAGRVRWYDGAWHEETFPRDYMAPEP